MDEIIEHLKKMQGQAEENLEKDEIGTWHRGFYSGEIRAYKHCTKYLQCHLTSAMHADGEEPGQFNVRLKTSKLPKWKPTSKF